MSVQRWILTLALGFSPLVALPDDAPDISGTWAATIDTQVGKQEYTYTFLVKGSQLTGQAKSANGTTQLSEGKVEGRKVTFVENLTYQGMPLRIAYTGTVATVDSIDFTRDVAGIAMEAFTAKRTKVVAFNH